MPQVVVTIADRTFRMACEPGDEAHLTKLAEKLDHRIAAMRGGFGEIGELKLVLMAAIAATDDLDLAEKKIAGLERRVSEGDNTTRERTGIETRQREAFAAAMDETAASLERMAHRLGAE